MRCQGVTSKGYGCINQARRNGLCAAHDHNNWCKRPTASGEPCKRRAAQDGGPCTKHA